MSYDIEFRQDTTVSASIKLVNKDGSTQSVSQLSSAKLIAEHKASGSKKIVALQLRAGSDNDCLLELTADDTKTYTAGEWEFEIEGVMSLGGAKVVWPSPNKPRSRMKVSRSLAGSV